MIKPEIEHLTHRFETELHELIDIKSQIMQLLNKERIKDEYVDKITTRVRNAAQTFTAVMFAGNN